MLMSLVAICATLCLSSCSNEESECVSCSQNIDSECKSLAQLSQMTKKEEHKTVKAMSDDCFNTLCSERFSQIMALSWSQDELQHWQTIIDTLEGKMHIFYGAYENSETQRYGKMYDDWAKEGIEKFNWKKNMTDAFVKTPFRYTFTQQILDELREGKEFPVD